LRILFGVLDELLNGFPLGIGADGNPKEVIAPAHNMGQVRYRLKIQLPHVDGHDGAAGDDPDGVPIGGFRSD